MTQQEQFEADYLAAFPNKDIAGLEFHLQKHHGNRYTWQATRDAYEVWLQQAKRHKAELSKTGGLTLLWPAIRQYRHNDGSDGFVFGYDQKETERFVRGLRTENERLRGELAELRAMLAAAPKPFRKDQVVDVERTT